MNLRISWLAIVALVALSYVLASGLANPRTRPFIIGLVALIGMGAFFLFAARVAPVPAPSLPRSIVTERAFSDAPPQPSPPKSSANVQPRMGILAALRQAIVQEWMARGSALAAEAPNKPATANPPSASAKAHPPTSRQAAKAPDKAKVNPPVASAKAQLPASGQTAEAPDPQAKASASNASASKERPAWVNAEPRVEDGFYTMSLHVGPFTTPLECERELPRALQDIVSEYAELSLGHEASAIRLPDNTLQQLVRERWPEVRPVDIGGNHQDMFSLHARVVFDQRAQQQIKSEAQRLVQQIQLDALQLAIGARVKGAAVIFGGVLGLLALAWGGLKMATRKQAVKEA
jgi:hypothetical protein